MMDESICPQDCVKKGKEERHHILGLALVAGKIKMEMQLNVPQTDRGILSTRDANMTCRCDLFSCHCVHLKFQNEDPPRKRKDQIYASCK